MLIFRPIFSSTQPSGRQCRNDAARRSSFHAVSDDGPPFRPNLACPKLFVVSTEAGGLGHRVSALAAGVTLALRARAALVVDDSAFLDAPRLRSTENYPFLAELFQTSSFLSLHEFERFRGAAHTTSNFTTPWGSLKFVDTPSVDESVDLATRTYSCGAIFPLRVGWEACRTPDGGRLDYCFIPGAYSEARPVLSALFQRSVYAKTYLHLYADEEVTRAFTTRKPVIAWHVRNDDLQLHAGERDYWAHLTTAVTTLVGRGAAHHLFCQNSITPDGPFGFLLTLDVGFRVHAGTPIDVAFVHLARATVLVHSGSSFSLAAGLLAPSSQLVQLAPPPKEFIWGRDKGEAAVAAYALDGTVNVEPDGRLSPEAQALFARRFAEVYHI